MNIKQIDKLILIILILAVISLNYSAIDSFVENVFSTNEEVNVERVIDGDTVESNIGNIRLLGINTPERGEFYYDEAKAFLGSRVFNKTVIIEFTKERYDKYNRTLAYILLDNRNINIEIVENGFANYYFYDGLDKYSDELEDAWDKCMENKINLCEPSQHPCSSCINISSAGISNSCAFSCDISSWTIKGEGRDKVVFPAKVLQPNEKAVFELDLTDSSGSLFLRDEKGKLVVWKKGE